MLRPEYIFVNPEKTDIRFCYWPENDESFREQLRALAEYLLVHDTIEAEEFNYFFEHGEFMPEEIKAVRKDKTIERPARKISMIDGYAQESGTSPENEGETPAQTESGEDSAAPEENPGEAAEAPG